jgi:hypothetical protein
LSFSGEIGFWVQRSKIEHDYDKRERSSYL